MSPIVINSKRKKRVITKKRKLDLTVCDDKEKGTTSKNAKSNQETEKNSIEKESNAVDHRKELVVKKLKFKVNKGKLKMKPNLRKNTKDDSNKTLEELQTSNSDDDNILDYSTDDAESDVEFKHGNDEAPKKKDLTPEQLLELKLQEEMKIWKQKDKTRKNI